MGTTFVVRNRQGIGCCSGWAYCGACRSRPTGPVVRVWRSSARSGSSEGCSSTCTNYLICTSVSSRSWVNRNSFRSNGGTGSACSGYRYRISCIGGGAYCNGIGCCIVAPEVSSAASGSQGCTLTRTNGRCSSYVCGWVRVDSYYVFDERLAEPSLWIGFNTSVDVISFCRSPCREITAGD